MLRTPIPLTNALSAGHLGPSPQTCAAPGSRDACSRQPALAPSLTRHSAGRHHSLGRRACAMGTCKIASRMSSIRASTVSSRVLWPSEVASSLLQSCSGTRRVPARRSERGEEKSPAGLRARARLPACLGHQERITQTVAQTRTTSATPPSGAPPETRPPGATRPTFPIQLFPSLRVCVWKGACSAVPTPPLSFTSAE